MKIIQVIQKPQLRGAEIFACQLSNHLVNNGHDVIVVAIFEGEAELPFKGEIVQLNRPYSQRLYDWTGWRQFKDILKRFNTDIVQANASDTLKFTASSKYFFGWKNKLIFRNANKMGDFINTSLKKSLNSFYLKQLDYVISVSKECEKDFSRTFEFPPNKIETITIGVEDKNIKNISKDLKDIFLKGPVLTHIGGFVPEKNHVGVINIFKEIHDEIPNSQLLLIGKGNLQNHIRELVQKKKLNKNVHFLDYRTDVLEILNNSSLFLLPSFIEGLPAVLLESMYCGCPVIAYDVGGIGEVVKSGVTGQLITTGDEKLFIEKSLLVLNNLTIQKEIQRNSKQLVKNNFTNLKISKEFEDCYKKLINDKNAISGRKKLKILQIIQKKQYRGAEIFCCQLSNELLEKGHEVLIYSIYDGKSDLPFQNKINVLNSKKNFRYIDYNGWKHINKVIKDFKPDIVQANAADTLKYTVFSKKIYNWKQPILYRNASVSSFYIKTFYSKKFNSFLLKNVSSIVSVSNFSRNDLNILFPFTNSISKVIPIGVVADAYQNLISPYNSEFKNIAHVGSLTEEKQHLKLLKIFSEIIIRNPNLILHIIGDGPLKFQILKKINELDLKDKVILHGELEFPQPYIKFADALVLPSLIEGLPAVILEAMYCKTPVVAYDVGGISEILNKKTGYLVENLNNDSFVLALEKALRDSSEQVLENANRSIVENYLIKDIAKEFIFSYEELIMK
ncbi:glycosyltransferase [Gramella sp. AN32]|uniref:Glycosyltransferase n=1 Tax=Christiangramia antarctica TaxID=2058158 RepID=A0ABW5X2W2_9FLAO|nr:glycosyltransferase [Gramella sp. AN32]MCM4157110.1 hypothetical protein [Gramella sp. AN32]